MARGIRVHVEGLRHVYTGVSVPPGTGHVHRPPSITVHTLTLSGTINVQRGTAGRGCHWHRTIRGTCSAGRVPPPACALGTGLHETCPGARLRGQHSQTLSGPVTDTVPGTVLA